MLTEQEIQLLNLFKGVDEVDQRTIMSLLETRQRKRSSPALTLVRTGLGDFDPSPGRSFDELSPRRIASSI